MIAVIFEFTPASGRKQEYLDLAAALKPELERADGFVSIERFESLSNPGHFVSLSFWRDEEALRKWRNLAEHREAQAKGRGGIFSGYRLRVAGVLRDYTHAERGQAPTDSAAFHG
jgi:heme-degrading monooxygenase HmoA